MEKENVKTSAAQKTAQKKYDEKTKMLSIKYTPVDMADYEKLRTHLEENGLSANQFIKGLIHDYFDPVKKAAAVPETEAVPAQAPKEAGSGTGSVVPEWFD